MAGVKRIEVEERTDNDVPPTLAFCSLQNGGDIVSNEWMDLGFRVPLTVGGQSC